MPKISVIMPVYNSELYLSETIESILNQTYKDFELILVDDGSKDSSGKICDDFAAKDDRIVVVHQRNGGICNARNTGLKIAKGEYIGFSDNDDFMMPQCLEKAIDAAETTKAEIVRFVRRRIYITAKKTLINEKHLDCGYTVEINNWESYIRVIEDCHYGVWAGIIKANFLYDNNLSFNEFAKFGAEDILFTVEACGKAQTITVIPDVLYEWITRPSSSTSQKSGENVIKNKLEAIMLWKKIEDQIGDKLNRSDRDAVKRLNEYSVMMMKEIDRLNVPYQERRKMLRVAKEKMLNGKNLSLSLAGSLKNKAKVFCAKYDLLFTFKALSRCLYIISENYQEN